MQGRCVIVFDVGKTNAKLTLWTPEARLLQRCVRPNDRIYGPGYRALDVEGLDAWLAETLNEYARMAAVGAIVPVGHGAAAALVGQHGLLVPPMDYEDEPTAEERASYLSTRDPFEHTGSPALPQGLNLGMQLHRLERLTGPWGDDVRILPWPQYWAWRLCGVLACEVTSLGCHSDLWRPLSHTWSDLARQRGWAQRLGCVRRAGEVLGTLSEEWMKRTGLPADCAVLCGLHDSNAALLAARGHEALAGNDATVLSTGTWFIALRSPSPETSIDTSALAETRDCLINVDVNARPVPSARFMGGREAELIGGLDIHALTRNYDPERLIARLPAVLASGALALPTFVRGVGPFPNATGEWRNRPADPGDQRAITGLYLALMADAALTLIGSRDRLLIEGRFAEAVIFVRALAALRADQQVYVSNAHDDVSYGALRLLHPNLKPASILTPVEPLSVDFRAFAATWRAHAARSLA